MVFLILDRKIERSQALLKQLRMEYAAFSAAEDMPALADINICQIL